MEWTADQRKVIELRDRDILVSAAAGSGKTAVLVQRIMARISEGETPPDIDRLLVVTFTKAAASEMRERILDAITAACEKEPDNAHLQRQAALIHNAMITTIDSFCLFVVRNHFGEIGLDPNFRIADEGEIRLLEQDVLTDVFERQYEKKEEGFLGLLAAYGGSRNDDAVSEMVAEIYRASQSSPWPQEWIAGLLAPYRIETEEALLQTEAFAELAEHVRLLLCDMKESCQALLEISQAADGPQAYAAGVAADLALFSGVETLFTYRQQQEFLTKLPGFGRLSPIRSFSGDPAKKDAVTSGRTQIKKQLEELKKTYFSMDLPALLAQQKRLLPYVEELVRLSLAYTEAMDQAKRKKRVVDFSDIEHFALRILVDEQTKQPRRTAEEFRAQFAEIMIDEYQDSNQVQEDILRAISREPEGGHNRFMVGDVKQSIYRFRQARPELFMEKYAAYSTEDGERQRIELHKNFRSRGQVLNFCNDIFYKTMASDMGRVQYDEEAALYVGAAFPENDGMEPELLLLDLSSPLLQEQEIGTKAQAEAHLIAARITRLMKETKVTDKESGQLRPLRYSDIVILLRSLKDYGTTFARVLADAGIPAYAQSSTGYFAATEVQVVLSMLRILDNPYQDIPMAAVLRSPMAGLSEEELAQIAAERAEVSFSEAALLAMQEATEGALAQFYEIYKALRAKRDLPIHELIDEILRVTGYGSLAAALPAGQQRAANLSMLTEKAVAYEKTSYKGLFHFLRYMDKLQKYEVDFGEADVTGENADLVRLMTIHKSKGLEFPVVFVSGLGRNLNQRDTSGRMVLHPDLGLGLCEISGKPRVKKNSIFRSEIAARLRRETLGEELRVLYVALTRAKEKLILTGTVKEWEKTLQGYTGNIRSGCPISYRQRVDAKCYLDWVLPALLSYPMRYTPQPVPPEEIAWQESGEQAEADLSYDCLLEQVQRADPSPADKLFSYEYPYKSEAGKKSKYSVSELKHAAMTQTYDRTEGGAAVPEFLREEKEIYVPSFARDGQTPSSGKNTAAERGTAVHRVMECLDFAAIAALDPADAAAVENYVQKELTRMRASGELSEEWYALIDPRSIRTFVASPVAKRMADADRRGELYREKPFVMQWEGVLVQGIIDVFWQEADGLVLLDYKTDRVQSAGELVSRYQTQLELYADALSRVFSADQKQVRAREKLIYSFYRGEVIAL